MKSEDFKFKAYDGLEVFVYKWMPDLDEQAKGVVQISHGMAEMASRYERFAESLTKAGYIVYANDHRGHGKTAGKVENVGYLGEDGFNGMIKDMLQLNEIIKQENPNKKVFLFGHSMGSLLSQRYIQLHGNTINGVILSGTSGPQGFMLNIGSIISKQELKKIGPKAQSKKMNKLTFQSYNKGFKPNRTEFDWLSSDNTEVDKYINDPFCGGVFSAQFFYDFLNGFKEIHKKSNINDIPKTLPVYIMSGEKDPVGSNCKTLTPLINLYNKAGIKDVSHKFYKDGRHEMLNEKNRDEVIKDIINWFDIH